MLDRRLCRPGGLLLRDLLQADAHAPALRPVDVEGAGLHDEIAELGMAIGAGIEIRGEIGHPLAHLTQMNPAVFAIHLVDHPPQRRTALEGCKAFRPAERGWFGAEGSGRRFSVKMKRRQAWRKLSGVFCSPKP